MELLPDWLEFIDLFNSNEVEYLIVGAFAMGFYRLPRATGDIDFFVNPTYENSLRVVKALSEFGFAHLGLAENVFAKDNQFLMLGRPPGRLDILTSIDGVHFSDAYRDREFGTLGGRTVPFLSQEHLIVNKLATGRLKDKADAQKLQRSKAKQDRRKSKD
jgi:hypothetical protein